ncbi:T9SS type A sorting domain-containing protein [Polaribacter pectinis]|uniref:T9SS type A sorting domain-containing protein n=1 Tax=Polaribacter pectinis TaxID=2738844 RepID=A0A7G9L6Q7_9FLAO|nr:T9SS type A sorting domain-containing protein [Polaribacter pectinis]QNM84306.1 T9SS type A sorting domain-containing protein [Polaribacter pectinis]
MKKITFLFTILITSVCFSQNLITNGGFEDGALSDWGTLSYTSEAVTSHETMTPRTGSYFATRGLYSAALIQEFAVTPGSTYTVDFYYGYNSEGTYNNPGMFKIRNRTGNTNGAFMDLTPLVADNGANASNSQNYGATWAPPHYTWKQGSFTFVAAADMTLARFQWWNDSNAMAYLDDVSITENTLSVKNFEKFNFSHYPNPTTNELNVSSSKNIEKIEIFNLIGQKVISTLPNINKIKINVSCLNTGVYIIKATINGVTDSFKFIKE